jgi:MarR family transcriptional regulator, organic hydroperoxide resistance regulator
MEEESDYLELKEQVCFPVYALSRAIIGHYRPLLDELEISYPQYLVLLLLWEHEPQTVGQLCEQLRLDNGTITPLLKRLEQHGIVIRKRSTSDERVVEVCLTPKGISLKAKAVDIPAKMLASLGITGEELQQLKTITTKILNKPSCNAARHQAGEAK